MNSFVISRNRAIARVKREAKLDIKSWWALKLLGWVEHLHRHPDAPVCIVCRLRMMVGCVSEGGRWGGLGFLGACMQERLERGLLQGFPAGGARDGLNLSVPQMEVGRIQPRISKEQRIRRKF